VGSVNNKQIREFIDAQATEQVLAEDLGNYLQQPARFVSRHSAYSAMFQEPRMELHARHQISQEEGIQDVIGRNSQLAKT
jgi:hypothetical protein